MEHFVHLENMQLLLGILGSRSHPVSPRHRTLVEVVLMLVKTSSSLSDLQKTCQEVGEGLLKIPADLLEEAWANISQETTAIEPLADPLQTKDDPGKQAGDAEYGCSVADVEYVKAKKRRHPPPPEGAGCVRKEKKQQVPVAVVGLNAMERARSTMEDFVSSYFMFHELDYGKPADVLRHPLLFFAEAFIYQADEENEEGLLSEGDSDLSVNRDPLGPLQSVLSERGLLDSRIEKELADGREFWALERSLCSALANKRTVQREEVIRALHLKSFDYRVLNLLLYQLQRREVNEAHLRFLSLSEVLVEISDDLFDYEEDVVKNTFNILRMFVAIYGVCDGPLKLAEYIGEVEEEYQLLQVSLKPELAERYRQRCREAVRQGGFDGGMDAQLGLWSMPQIIVNEHAFRTHVNQTRVHQTHV